MLSNYDVYKWGPYKGIHQGILAVSIMIGAIILLSHARAMASQTSASTSRGDSLSAQTHTEEELQFDVASVKLNLPNTKLRTNFGLDSFEDTGHLNGILSANTYLIIYITFAYKLPEFGPQRELLQKGLPTWAMINPIAVEARAVGNPTKYEVRQMVKHMLADRFKLKMHIETKELPVYALVLAKPGKYEVGLQPHSTASNCDERPAPSLGPAPSERPKSFFCGDSAWQEGDQMHLKMINTTIEHLAEVLTELGDIQQDIDQQLLVDGTGLSDHFDVNLVFRPHANASVDAGPDAGGQTAVEAMKKQLGLKLIKQVRPVNVFVIDHIEKPSDN